MDQSLLAGADLSAAVASLLAARRYETALSAVDSAIEANTVTRAQLRRRCYARLEDFASAATFGQQVIVSGRAEPEDHYRQAQILMKCGRPDDALTVGLGAFAGRGAPPDWLGPLVQAVLAAPRLVPRLLSGLSARSGPASPASPAPDPADVSIPMRLPYYQTLDGAHPWIMGLVAQSREEISYSFPGEQPGDLAAAVAGALPAALAMTERLMQIHPSVTRAIAAEYVASRFISALYPAGQAKIDLLSYLPMTIEPRPFVMVFDFMPILFQPMFAAEHMSLGPDDPMLRIMRAVLEGPACRSILTTYSRDRSLLRDLFDSERIAQKCVLLNTVHSMDEISHNGLERGSGKKATNDKITLFFPSSFNWKPDGFFMRGGVDAINAFLTLAPRFPNLHLVVRSRLPETLSDRLTDAVHTHPRITWLPDYLSWEEYKTVLDDATILLLPAMELYRNSVVQGMSWGMVPVISDCTHVGDFVEDEQTGVIVKRETLIHGYDALNHTMYCDWRQLYQSTDQPADSVFFGRYVTALGDLIASPERMRRLGANARTSIERRRHSQADLAKFVDVLKTSLA